MSATYDPMLPADKDWVRFLVGDATVTPASSAALTDEEIAGILAEEPTVGTKAAKYYAAATALETMSTRWASGGKGISEIRVGSLDIKQGVDASSSASISDRVKYLRQQGARFSSKSSRLRALGAG